MARLVGYPCLVAGFGRAFSTTRLTWAITLSSKPHLGGTLQFNPEPQPVLGSAVILPKRTLTEYKIRKVIINQITKEVTPNSPFFKNQVLFSSYMSKEGSIVENSLSYTRLRGDKEFR
jgi:hypothetical protein